jgi:hypothetical protein
MRIIIVGGMRRGIVFVQTAAGAGDKEPIVAFPVPPDVGKGVAVDMDGMKIAAGVAVKPFCQRIVYIISFRG